MGIKEYTYHDEKRFVYLMQVIQNKKMYMGMKRPVQDQCGVQKCLFCREGETTSNSFTEKGGFYLDLKYTDGG